MVYSLVGDTGTFLTLDTATKSIILRSTSATDSNGSPYNSIKFKVSLQNHPTIVHEKPLSITINR